MKLVHSPPAKTMRSPAMSVMKETTTRARAAWRSALRASMESYTLHCIWPVLWSTQFIQIPSHMICEVTTLLPIKAETRHIGKRQTGVLPTICIPLEAMVLSLWGL
ncbi:hypothetical protein Q8A73_007121 [Channa argus]|nr:hypothetical protein Q8A73_007121 [Channa argus]